MALLAVAFVSWLPRVGFFAAYRAALLDLVIVILGYKNSAYPRPESCFLLSRHMRSPGFGLLQLRR